MASAGRRRWPLYLAGGAVSLAYLIWEWRSGLEGTMAEKGGGSWEAMNGPEDPSLAATATGPRRTNDKAFVEPPGAVRPILIVYGTEYGCSRELAKRLRSQIREDARLSAAGVWPRVVDLEDHQVVDWAKEQLVLVVCSTYGDGVPPTTARAFFDGIEAAPLRVPHLRFSVLALGDTNYPHYCRAGKTLDAALEAGGASRVYPRVDVDQEDGSVIDRWLDGVVAALGPLVDTLEVRPDYLWEAFSSGAISFGDALRPGTKKVPLLSRIAVKRPLTTFAAGAAEDKETIHVEFDLDDSQLQYVSGDSLGVYPLNDAALVAELAAALSRCRDGGAAAAAEIPTPDWHYRATASGTQEPPALPPTLPLAAALQQCFDLKNVRPELVQLLTDAASDAAQQARGRQLLADGGVSLQRNAALQQYLEPREVIDVLQDFASALPRLPLADVLARVKALLPRYYSISSAQLVEPRRVSLTAAVVRYQTLGRARKGVATCHLQDVTAVGDRVPVFVNNNPDFRLPADGARDIIMIGPGTGLAPFRAFIQERLARAATGRNVLFFGCRNRDRDFLYRDELEALHAAGKIQLHTAFSRDQGHKVYVQQRIAEAGADLWGLIAAGAHLYICGDAAQMEAQVRDALLDKVLVQHGAMTRDAAEAYLHDMEKAKRFQKDTWF